MGDKADQRESKRNVQLLAGLCDCLRRLGSRAREYLDVSLSSRAVRRCGVFNSLSSVTFLFGWVGLCGEFAIGRLARTGTIGSYEYCFARRGRKKLGAALSWIPLLGSLGIAIGYAVILGWVLRSLAGSVTGELLTADVEAFFHQASGSFGSVPGMWRSLCWWALC